MSKFLAVLFTVGCFMTLPLVAQDSDAGSSDTPVDEYSVKDVNYWTGVPYLGGNSNSYSGDTTGGPLWDRPFASGTCCSTLGPVSYQIEYLRVGATGEYNLLSEQDFDGYIFIYQDTFDPLDQEANFVAGDDDGPGGIGTSEILGVTLEADRTYIIVTTAFSAGLEGVYTNTVEGPGDIRFGLASIPTLGEWGMVAFVMLLAGAGVFLSRRGRIA